MLLLLLRMQTSVALLSMMWPAHARRWSYQVQLLAGAYDKTQKHNLMSSQMQLHTQRVSAPAIPCTKSWDRPAVPRHPVTWHVNKLLPLLHSS
jgi:hypothetical protein